MTARPRVAIWDIEDDITFSFHGSDKTERMARKAALSNAPMLASICTSEKTCSLASLQIDHQSFKSFIEFSYLGKTSVRFPESQLSIERASSIQAYEALIRLYYTAYVLHAIALKRYCIDLIVNYYAKAKALPHASTMGFVWSRVASADGLEALLADMYASVGLSEEYVEKLPLELRELIVLAQRNPALPSERAEIYKDRDA